MAAQGWVDGGAVSQLTCVGVLLLRMSRTGGDDADGGGVFATGTSTSPAGASQSSHTDDAHEVERDAPARTAAVAARAPPVESCMTTSAWYDERPPSTAYVRLGTYAWHCS